MNYEIRVSQIAVKDIENISFYISEELQNPIAAKRLVSNITKAILSLSEFPFRHRLYYDEPFKSRGVRVFSVGDYLIFYSVTDKTVNVSRVLHGIMDVEKLIDDSELN